MKRFAQFATAAILGLALSAAAWAQQRDLEVTMEVVPANAAAGAVNEIRLPLALPEAASRGEDASAFGQDTARMARDKELFGRAQSERARAKNPSKKGGS